MTNVIQPLESDATEERREVERHRAFKKGAIVLGARTGVIDCLVRNISETGAYLTVEQSLSVPDEFELMISEEQRSAPVRVVRRGNNEIAVNIVGPWKQLSKKPDK